MEEIKISEAESSEETTEETTKKMARKFLDSLREGLVKSSQ